MELYLTLTFLMEFKLHKNIDEKKVFQNKIKKTLKMTGQVSKMSPAATG